MTQARILLVEDDKALLDGMHDFLQISQYHVTVAENGAAALDVLQSEPEPPDLIVSDIMMPNMDGYQLLAAVRERQDWSSIPFIFMTAKGARQDIRSGMHLGADDYIVKPFEAEVLLDAIKARLKRQAALDKFNETRMSLLKRRILTTLNHEFRTPLSYVVAYSDMIMTGKEELDRQELYEFLMGIHTGGERLRQLVEDFLLLVELESGQARPTYELRKSTIHQPSEFIASVVENYRARAEVEDLKLTFEGEPNLPPIQGDYTYLNTSLGHLIGNGIKFTRKKGTSVHVGVGHEEGYVTIAVQDDGVGISPEEHQRLFDLFYQSNREEMEQQGIGAGLTILKYVAELHNGRVTVDSELGKGACFTLYLPVFKG